MKISEILNEKIDNGPGKITNVPKINYDRTRSSAITSLSKSERNRIKQQLAAAKGKQREMAKATRAAEKAAEKEAKLNTASEQRKMAAKRAESDLAAIMSKIDAVIGDTWPDGDPLDHLGPWMKKRFGENVEVMTYLDKAVRKDNKKYKGYYDYLATLWHDFEMDRQFDEFMANYTGDKTAAISVWHETKEKEIETKIKRENPWR